MPSSPRPGGRAILRFVRPTAFRLGAFALERPIGRGGMGEVYAGRHVATGVPVAVKLLSGGKWGTLGIDLFRAEVRAVASLHHPSIVMVLDQGAVTEAEAVQGRFPAGAPWLAMELCTGGTLLDVRGAMTWPAVRAALLTLLDGLAHAHARGVVHRDIKPGNVLLGADGDLRPGLKLTDFGIARVVRPGAREVLDEDTFAGSPSYAAPEQLEGKTREIGPWTDLFSLGCLAWTICTGAPPGSGRPLAALVRSRIRGEVPMFEPIQPMPAGLTPWLLRLLAPRPQERFAGAADAAWALLQQTPDPEPAELLRVDLPALAAMDQATVTGGREPSEAQSLTALLTQGPRQEARHAITRIARDAGAAPETRPSRSQPPPLVDDWRRLDPPAPPMTLLGAGLGLYGLRTIPMVGREDERDRLWDALRDVVRTGQAGAVLVEGPAGVGKSRVVQWIAERADELGVARVIRALHGDPPGTIDGLPSALERALRVEGLDGAELEELLTARLETAGVSDPWLPAGLAELIRPGATLRRDGRRVTLPTGTARLEVMTDALRVLASDRPVLLILDDLQWGREAAALAHRLVRGSSLDRLPVLVIGTVRTPVAPQAPGAAGLERLRGLDIPRIDLERLATEEQRALVTDLLQLHGSLVDEVLERTDGNPLFAIQLVGDWVRRGELHTTDAGWQRAEAAQVALPDDLHALWVQRFDHALAGAGDTTWRALELGAALGQEVDASEWLEICYVGGLTPAGLVESLVDAGLARRTPRGWTFVHGMARDSVARRSREEGRWGVLHALCARHLQTAHAPEDVVRRGRHRLEAGQFTAAAGDLRLGIQTSLRRGRIAVAEELLGALDEALAASRLPPDDQRILTARLLRFRIRRVRTRREDPDGLRALLEAARAAGHPHLECDAQRELGIALRNTGKSEQARDELRAAAGLAEALSYPACQGRALSSLGYALFGLGDREGAVQAFQRALSVLQPLDDHQGLASAYRGLCEVANRVGMVERARAWAERALQLAEAIGDSASEADAWVLLASTALGSQDLEAAAVALERARAARKRAGNLSRLSDIHNLEGEVARARGEHREAEIAYREALALSEAAGSWTFIARMNLAMVLMDGGRFVEALEPIRAARASLIAAGLEPLVVTTNALLLPALASAGLATELDEILVALESALPTHARRDKEVLQALRWAAPILERHDDPERAARVAGLATLYARHLEVSPT